MNWQEGLKLFTFTFFKSPSLTQLVFIGAIYQAAFSSKRQRWKKFDMNSVNLVPLLEENRSVVALRWAFLFSWFCWPFFNLFLMAFPIFQGFFSRNHFLEGCFSFQGHEVMSPPCGRMGDVPPHGRCPPCGSPSHAFPLWETLHVEVHEHYHTPYNDRTVKGSSLFVNVLWFKAFLRVGMFLFGVVYHASIL